MKKIDISIITPCYNEEENVEECAFELKKIMQKYLPSVSYEHIFIDNCSTDFTFTKLCSISKNDKRVKIVRNSRNVGSMRNVWEGMKYCSGNYIVPSLAADLQDPPRHLPDMYKILKSSSALMVYGVMVDREERYFLKKLRKYYYILIAKLSETPIPLNHGEFLIADAKVVKSLLSSDDQFPYVRGLFAQTQVKSVAYPYKRVKRLKGKSGENFVTLVNHAVNGFISTSTLLPRLITVSGITIAAGSVLMGLFNLIGFLTENDKIISNGIPTILISMFFLSGIQLLFLGILSEYIQAIYRQVRRTPAVFPIDMINFK
jgi:glycosyltransferase involved in cell wall biosynthesis